MPDVSELVTTTALAAVKNTIATVNDIYEKIKNTQKNIYITLTDYNKFMRYT